MPFTIENKDGRGSTGGVGAPDRDDSSGRPFGRAGPRGGKPKNELVNGVSAASLVPVDFENGAPPYLHLMLGFTNDVVKEIYKDLAQLGSTDPKKVEAALQRRMEMAELELLIANAVGDLVGQLGSDARDFVDRIAEGMATATEDEDAAASVAAPRGGGARDGKRGGESGLVGAHRLRRHLGSRGDERRESSRANFTGWDIPERERPIEEQAPGEGS